MWCVSGHVCATAQVWKSKDTCESQFSLFTMWGIKFTSFGLEAGTFT